MGTRKSDTNTTRGHQREEPGRVPLVVWSPPLARDIPYPRLGEASWTTSLEVNSLVVVVSLLLPPIWKRLFLQRGGPTSKTEVLDPRGRRTAGLVRGLSEASLASRRSLRRRGPRPEGSALNNQDVGWNIL